MKTLDSPFRILVDGTQFKDLASQWTESNQGQHQLFQQYHFLNLKKKKKVL